MDNKGFTLVELLAVMVILISISLIAVAGITSSLERRDEKEREEQIELAIGAAKIYFSLENKTCVKLSDLISLEYIKSDDRIDTLDTNYVIRLSGNSYVYEEGDC